MKMPCEKSAIEAYLEREDERYAKLAEESGARNVVEIMRLRSTRYKSCLPIIHVPVLELEGNQSR